MVCSLRITSSSDMFDASSILMPELISKSINARSLQAFQYVNFDVFLFILFDKYFMSFDDSSIDSVLGNLRSFFSLNV